MKIFVSWSGKFSHEVALALRDWLPLVLPSVQLWVSSEDIRKGRQWFGDLANQFTAGDTGIFCLTAENLSSPWINFEAGALTKALPESALWTILLGQLTPQEIKGPFEQFQHTNWNLEDLRRLIHSINSELGGEARPTSQVDSLFDRLWPELAEAVARAASENPQVIYLSDLGKESDVVVKRTFQNVVIRGPGIIFPQNCAFEHCGFAFHANLESILWPIDPARTEVIVGAIGFIQCKFLHCRFEGIGMAGAPELLEHFRRKLLDPDD